jgi:hypothetical protein
MDDKFNFVVFKEDCNIFTNGFTFFAKKKVELEKLYMNGAQMMAIGLQ